jgi:hypothetical protein
MSTKLYKKMKSPRHGFEFSDIPTKKGSVWGGSITVHYEEDYAAILDSTYEMADQISTSNGWSIDKAIESALHDNSWTMLPKHKKLIKARLIDSE